MTMAESTIIMHKAITDLDNSVQAKAMKFLGKLIKNDALPGIHIEPISNSVDPKYRTGRVDDYWRAVLFKLSGSSANAYLFYGVVNHDDSIGLARKLRLDVNPINGIPEITRVKDDTNAAELAAEARAETKVGQRQNSKPEPEEAPGSVTDSSGARPGSTALDAVPSAPTPLPAIGEKVVRQIFEQYSDDELHSGLGLAQEYIDVARAAATPEALLDGIAEAPEWQADALLDLATGTSLHDVKVKLGFLDDPEAGGGSVVEEHAHADESSRPATPAPSDTPPAENAEEAEADLILAGMNRDAAKLSFAVIEGEEELSRVLQDGDFQAWRVFLHPEQRRFARRDYNGPFRLSGGAGTGKTVVLVHRAVRLAEEHPDARVVLTTYTKNLAAELDSQVSALNPAAPRARELNKPGVYVRGIDALVSDVLRNAQADELSAAVHSVLGMPRTTVFQRPRFNDQLWNEAVAVAGEDLPERGDSAAFLQDEYEQVVLAKRLTDQRSYLRVKRPGRGIRLSRQQRASVWAVVEEYRARSAQQQVVSWEEARHIAAEVLRLRVRAAGSDVVGAADDIRSSAYPADHVIVDEGQDLVAGHWQFLRALVREGTPNDLFIAEDSHQRIYGRKVTLSDYGISIVGRSRRLTLNYRTTEANLHFGLGVLEGESFTDLENRGETVAGYRSLRAGVPPVVRGFDNEREENEFVAQVVRNWLEADSTLKPEHIAILVRDQRGQGTVVRGLADAGVDAAAVGAENVPTGRPVVMTMHRAKGTEFRKVVLWGVGRDQIPAWLKPQRYAEDVSDDVDLRERSLLYVAATRARDELVVTWHGEKSPLLGSAATA